MKQCMYIYMYEHFNKWANVVKKLPDVMAHLKLLPVLHSVFERDPALK